MYNLKNIISIILIGFTMPVLAKILTPDPIPPLIIEDIVYEVKYENENNSQTGLIVARTSDKSKQIWETIVFFRPIDPVLERDVQWIFFSKLEMVDPFILQVTMAKKTVRIERKTGKLLTPKILFQKSHLPKSFWQLMGEWFGDLFH